MKITVNINKPMSGQIQILTQADVDNWVDIIPLISFTECTFELFYDGNIYTGVISKALDNLSLNIVFVEPLILLPPGMCMLVTCVDEEDDDNVDGIICFNNNVSPLNIDTQLAVLDDNGCPVGYVTVSQLVTLIGTTLNVPNTLCELLGVTEIPQGPLIAGDRVLTTSGGCTLKSVSVNDIGCS